MHKYFSYKINKEIIDKRSKIVEGLVTNNIRSIKRRKILLYFTGVSGFTLYIYYLMKASGLMKKIEIDKKFISRRKKIEEKYNIDMEKNDKILKELDEKWEINKPLDDYENKIKYGNKEINNKVENLESIEENNSENMTEKNNSVIVQKLADNLDIVIADNYEQVKIYQGSENNQDPTKLGDTIIFDSRLDNFNKRI